MGRISSSSGPTFEPFLWEHGQLTRLGPQLRLSSGAMINRAGLIAGTMAVGKDWHAFAWENGKTTDLGILGTGEQASSEAYAVSSRGAVVGTSSTHGLGYHPFLWANGRMFDLGTLAQIDAAGLHLKKAFRGGPGSAQNVNDRGQTVGTVTWGKNLVYSRAFLWQDGHMRELRVPSGTWNSFATAINERGQIIGAISGPRNGDPSIAVLWHDGRLTRLGATGTDEVAINERGRILLNHYTEGPSVSVMVWENGAVRTISPRGAERTLAAGMNEAGTAVMNAGKDVWNYTTFPYPEGVRAWVCRRGAILRLPTLENGTSTWAAAINNTGTIVGAATGEDGTWHAVEWTLQES